jgi:uncharacterized membrane protein HdeD (DUF308 family)
VEIQLGSLAAALILAGAYLLAGWFSGKEASQEFWERRRWISAAAGVSVAYVFVDVLPELGAQQQAFTKATGNSGLLFVEQRMYALALLSFVVFYGLDHMVLSKRQQAPQLVPRGQRDAVYWLHLIGFQFYSGLIGYLLTERAERGSLSLAVYSAVMAVHFLVVEHSLSEQHGLEHRWSTATLLALSVLAGWLLGFTTDLSESTFARLFAILAGGVVITSLRHELPGDRRGRFWPFCLGAVLLSLALFASESLAA